MMRKKRTLKFAAATSMLALGMTALSACSSDSDEEINIVAFNGWEDNIAVSELWNYVLTEEGYDVTMEYADPAPGFSGAATGDYDLLMNVWDESTHANYLDEYGDDLEKIGEWYEDASNVIAVNADADIDTIDELVENADDFDNQLVGIEPGAGLTEITEDSVIPEYGMEDFDYVTSSTPAMLQEISTAESNGENIAVTLWHPHWAYEDYDLKDLEDTKDAYGGSETISAYGTDGFSDDHDEAAGWIEDFEMSEEQMESLQNTLFNENDGEDSEEHQSAIEDWVEENQDYVDSLTD